MDYVVRFCPKGVSFLIFFRLLQVYERVGISQVEVYETVGKSIILLCKKVQNF